MVEYKNEENFLLKEIEDSDKFCTGCAACDNVCPVGAIEMIPGELGFVSPFINNTLCIQCDMCRKACPVLNLPEKEDKILKCYAVQANDEVRKKSSSGGAFTLFAEEILRCGGAVVGAAMGDDCKVSHIEIESIKELGRLRKSKYVQSDIGKVYRQVKKLRAENRLVLFSGTPCQAAALKNVLDKDEGEGVFIIDTLCHGVPSYQMLRDYIDASQKKEVESVEFRTKEKGWRNSSRNMFLNYKDNTRIMEKYELNEYEQGFHSELILRNCCYECQFAELPHVSDITLGDYWGIRERDAMLDDDGGTSAVIINSLKGYQLFEKILKNISLYRETPVEWLVDNRIHDEIKGNISRRYFEHLYKKGDFINAVKCALAHKYQIGIVGPWMNINCGGALTYYALYRTLVNMGYFPVMLSQPKGSEWDPTYKYCRYKEIPYPEYAILPAKNGYPGQREFNNYCDTFIVGSDQLFTGEMFQLLDGYADLEWVNNNKRKIAYAASFAKDHFSGSQEQKERLSYFLQKFDCFSVREKTGIKLAKEEFGVSAEWVLDPVFLCDKKSWEDLLEKGKERLNKNPSIFGYILDPNDEKEKLMHLAEKILNLKSYAASDVWNEEDTLKWMWNIPTLSNLGNEELLAHIKNCEFVMTDSFHGVCFAIIFNKPFAVYINKDRGASRFYSLLKLLHLEERIIDSEEKLEVLLLKNKEISYENVNVLLEKEKERCISWLKNAIENPIPKREVSDYDMACTYSDRLEKMQKKRRKFEYDSLNGRIDWLIGHVDNDLMVTDQKQWEQLEDHRLRLDGLDSYIKRLEENLMETNKKQWEQLEDHRLRLDGLNSYIKYLEEKQQEYLKRIEQYEIESSWSYKIGKMITFFSRIIMKKIICRRRNK